MLLTLISVALLHESRAKSCNMHGTLLDTAAWILCALTPHVQTIYCICLILSNLDICSNKSIVWFVPTGPSLRVEHTQQQTHETVDATSQQSSFREPYLGRLLADL